MANVKFYLKDTHSKTETLVYMFFSFNGKRLKYSTGESVKPVAWNFNTGRVKKSIAGSMEVNNNLDKLQEGVKKFYRNAIANDEFISPDLLRKKLDGVGNGKNLKHTLFSFIENHIHSVQSIRKKSSLYIYRNALNHLKEFKTHTRKAIDFDTINLDFYNDFTDYLLREKNFSTNTIGKIIKTLKTFLNEATERGINIKLDFKSKRFKVLTEETEAIYLNEEELLKLYKLQLSKNNRLEKVRDLFIVGCYTGLRFSDFTQIKSENIKDGYIHIRTIKTDESISVPIHPMVKEIMKKYKGKYPNSLPPSITNQNMNEYLKEIGKYAEIDEDVILTKSKGALRVETKFKKYELITTHTARRSFATNLYLAGFPAISIMKITGHRTEKAFLRYIKIKPQENAMKLKEFWRNQKSILKVA